METEPKDHTTSQVPRNLIFGSSECDKVMERYESAWIYLFTQEHKLRKQYSPDTAEQYMKGWLSSDIRPVDGYTSQSDPPFKMKLTTTQQTERNKYETRWPWLCYIMHYELNLYKPVPYKPAEPPSWILGATELLFTDFFPFQRRFYTELEGIVDKLIIDHLYEMFDPKELRKRMEPPIPVHMIPLPTGNPAVGSSSRSHRTANELEMAEPIVRNEVTSLTHINAAPTLRTEIALPPASQPKGSSCHTSMRTMKGRGRL